jgi:hypothetical protein
MDLEGFTKQVQFNFLHEFAVEVMTIGFNVKPNYNKLRFLLQKNLMDIG